MLPKYNKSSKIISIMTNFNTNLLECKHHNNTNNFVNSMISHYSTCFLVSYTPRVTDHSSTVIDKIFSNVTVSGNIFNQIADYYSQFLILNKLHLNYKN